MQFDTPYYRDNLENKTVKYALVDASHTFAPNTKKFKDFTKYDLKKNELNTETVTKIRRVTYDP